MTLPSPISLIFPLLAGLGLVAAAACGSSSDTGGPADGGAAEGSTLPGDDAATDDPHDPLAWASPESARDLDGQLARVTLDLGQSSEHLRITDFGFAIPASATIKGVEIEFKRQAGDLGIGDGNIELWLDGAPSDRPKFVATSWPRVIVGTHHYGQAVDTWGNDLTAALVGKPGFGVEIYAVRQGDAGGAAIEARVESMRMTIFYCE